MDESNTEPSVRPYDAVLIVGFGGPEKPDDVMSFLENVTRGRNIPRERLLGVAEHYHHFGGVSPINGQVRALLAAICPEMERQGLALPVYWGNRNWHPMLADTMAAMTRDGVKRAVGLVLAAYSSYSSCRQYREDIEVAREVIGPQAPKVDKVRVFYNHPDFIAANADRVASALHTLPADLRAEAHLTFTAHSIPASMAANCDYERQLSETCRLVADSVGIGADRWTLVYQSRSGRPTDPWLGPDILDHLRDLHRRHVGAVVVHPVGFLSDHMEVLYDLDEEARQICDSLGLPMVRSSTVGTHPRFVSMLVALIRERLAGIDHTSCPADCCLPPARPRAATS